MNELLELITALWTQDVGHVRGPLLPRPATCRSTRSPPSGRIRRSGSAAGPSPPRRSTASRCPRSSRSCGGSRSTRRPGSRTAPRRPRWSTATGRISCGTWTSTGAPADDMSKVYSNFVHVLKPGERPESAAPFFRVYSGMDLDYWQEFYLLGEAEAGRRADPRQDRGAGRRRPRDPQPARLGPGAPRRLARDVLPLVSALGGAQRRRRLRATRDASRRRSTRSPTARTAARRVRRHGRLSGPRDAADRPAVLDISRVDGAARHRASCRTAAGGSAALTTWTDLARGATCRRRSTGCARRRARSAGARSRTRGPSPATSCNASPAADGMPNLLALDAAVEVASAARGVRACPCRDVRRREPPDRPPRRTSSSPAVVVPAIRRRRRGRRSAKLGSRAYLVISIVAVAAVVVVARRRRGATHGSSSGPARRCPQRLAALEAALVGRRAVRRSRRRDRRRAPRRAAPDRRRPGTGRLPPRRGPHARPAGDRGGARRDQAGRRSRSASRVNGIDRALVDRRAPAPGRRAARGPRADRDEGGLQRRRLRRVHRPARRRAGLRLPRARRARSTDGGSRRSRAWPTRLARRRRSRPRSSPAARRSAGPARRACSWPRTTSSPRTPSPTSAEVLDGLGGVLCRCTGYTKIVEAVASARRLARPATAESTRGPSPRGRLRGRRPDRPRSTA